MARKQDEVLFPEFDGARYGDSHRRRNLFLQKFLEMYSTDFNLENQAKKHAHEIIVKWAELESSGKLKKKKEDTLKGEFLTEVFGEALGFKLFSEGLGGWNLEAEYSVNGGEADAAIGLFDQNSKNCPHVVVEIKGPRVNLDRDRFNGRTSIQQCWDYLNALPGCPWGIVCNYVSFRLYHREHTPRRYELFTLQELREKKRFDQFYYLFERGGLLPIGLERKARADILLEKTLDRQLEVGDELYEY